MNFLNITLIAARLYSGIFAGALLFTAIGQALTGGMRLEARAADQPISAFSATTLVLFLVCVVFVAAFPRDDDQ